MRLRSLTIQQLPGVGAFALDGLADGANLITGPNAVGKSSLVRALRYLIGGARSGDPPALALSAEFDGDDGRWRVQRAGSQIVWTHDGQAAEPPALPDPDLLHCYWLRVEDLLTPDASDDRTLVERLRRELSGGFDLEALRTESPFAFGPQTGRHEARALQTARGERQRIESEHQALRSEAGRLPEMEAEAEAAEAAGRRVERLDQALSLLEARRQRLAAEQRLAELPPDMARLRGNELERLSDLETERAQCLERRDDSDRARQEATARLDETGLGAQRPDPSELQAQRERLNECRQLSDRLETEHARLREHRAQEQRAAAELGATETPPTLDPDSVGQASALGTRLHQARLERDARQAKFAEAESAYDPASNEQPLAPWIALAILLGAVGAGWAAALGPGRWPLAAAAFVAGAGLWALVAGLRHWLRIRDALNRRSDRHATRTDELRQAEAALDACEREREQFCRERGIDPALFEDAAALERCVRLALDLDQARNARAAAEATIKAREQGLAEHQRQVYEFLAAWNAAPEAADTAGLRAALDAFEERCRQAAKADDERRRAEHELERLDGELAGIDSKIAQLYADAGLESGDRETLEARCAAYETWQQRRREYDEAVSVETERRRPLADEAELLERVEAEDEAGLRDERERLAHQAAERDRLRDDIADLRTRLRGAGRKGELERAAAAEERAREGLFDQFDQAMLAAAGNFLLDTVDAEYRNEHEPAVLADARERFARFTHHGWALQVDPQHGFHAIDRASEEPRPLAELSSGTRMQLLLAVRIAWARQIERQTTSLPLVLDEALTTSDEHRFGEVASSLEQLVADEGRQVFYLSARRHEAHLWQQATGRQPNVIDLAQVRFGQSQTGSDDYTLVAPEPLPAPDGHGTEQYAALLGVPPIDPRQPASAIPLFHLLRDDLVLLHSLMEHWRVRNLGALEGLLASEAAVAAIPDAAMRHALTGRCRAARHWVGIWHQGRGKPVDRGVLEASGLISTTFIERVTALAEETEGDAESLIDALRAGRVPRFRSSITDELEDWLREHGYLDPAPPLDADARARQTLQAAAGAGDASDLRTVIDWLEAGLGNPANTSINHEVTSIAT